MNRGGIRRERRSEQEQSESKTPLTGVVVEALPNGMFRVEFGNASSMLATMSGPMRRFSVKVLPGDRVTVEASPYDPNRGRITYRHK